MVILNASDPKTAKKINDIIKKAKHIFILVYMVGCGPCNATRPEWKKMCQSLENKYSLNDDVAILDLDSEFMNEVEGLGDINGFPTMKYISDNGNMIEAYEDSNKDRSSNSFIEWIESKVSKKNGGGVDYSSPMNVNELSELLSYKQLNSTKTINSISELKKNKTKRIKTKRIKTKRIKTKRIKAKKTQKRKNKKQKRRKSH